MNVCIVQESLNVFESDLGFFYTQKYSKMFFFKEHQILYEDIYVNSHSMLLFHCIFDLYL